MQNTSGTKNMTEGNVKKLILQFAIPIFFSQLFQQLYNTAASVIIIYKFILYNEAVPDGMFHPATVQSMSRPSVQSSLRSLDRQYNR